MLILATWCTLSASAMPTHRTKSPIPPPDRPGSNSHRREFKLTLSKASHLHGSEGKAPKAPCQRLVLPRIALPSKPGITQSSASAPPHQTTQRIHPAQGRGQEHRLRGALLLRKQPPLLHRSERPGLPGVEAHQRQRRSRDRNLPAVSFLGLVDRGLLPPEAHHQVLHLDHAQDHLRVNKGGRTLAITRPAVRSRVPIPRSRLAFKGPPRAKTRSRPQTTPRFFEIYLSIPQWSCTLGTPWASLSSPTRPMISTRCTRDIPSDRNGPGLSSRI